MELTPNQRARIDKGAALLDEKQPDWFVGINLQSMDVNSFSHCPICQTFGIGFWDGCAQLGLIEQNDGYRSLEKASDYGFYPHDEDHLEDFAESTEQAMAKNAYWRELITRRLGGVK